MKPINKTQLFIVVTYGISFSIAGLFALSGSDFKKAPGFIMAIIYMFIPALSVLIVGKLIYKEDIIKPSGISFKINRWFIVAWLLPVVFGFGTLGISLLFPDVNYSPNMEGMIERFSGMLTPEQIEQMRTQIEKAPVNPFWLILLQGLFAGLTVNAVAAFGEELGWRGYLLKQCGSMSFFKGSLFIGFIWGLWHAPLILMGHNYPQHPKTGVLMMIIWCILLTPLFNYVRIKSKSVIAASIMHGSLNGTAGIAIVIINGGTDLLVGLTGLAGFLTLIAVNCGFFIYDRWITKEKIMGRSINEFLV